MAVELVSWSELPLEIRVGILDELGYRVDGEKILDKEGHRLTDRYTGKELQINNLAILPGSTILLDDNPISIASYFEEFGDPF